MCSSNNAIRLLRNFPISLGVVSVMQLRMLLMIVLKLLLALFMAIKSAKKVPSCLYKFNMCAMKYVVVFVIKMISYTECTNAFIFLNGFSSRLLDTYLLPMNEK